MPVFPIEINNKDLIAIIAPHPDDECIGVGGVMSLFANQCDIYVMTDGGQGQKNISPVEERKIRRKQFEKEMEYVQVRNYYWMGYEDGALLGNQSCMREIDFSVYTKIFIPWGNDNHPDHTATNIYAIEEIKKQKVKNVDVYEYEVHVPFHDVTHYIDITKVIKMKKKLIQFHEDQLKNVCFDEIAVSLAKYRACQENQKDKYYESFVKIDLNKQTDSNRYVNREIQIQKFRLFYRTLLRWIGAKHDGKNIKDYIKKNNLRDIAIYGYGDMGKLLYNELAGQGIHINEILDKRKDKLQTDKVRIKLPKDGNRKNTIIVTAIHDFEDVKGELKELGYLEIVSLQDIIEKITT